jgi:uncharacterized membrane protein YfcA
MIGSVDLLYSFSGFGVGVLVGMTGVGGGSLMTPLLVIIFGIHPATAVGTDLLYAAATKSAGTLIHGLHSTIDWRVVGRLAGRRRWCDLRYHALSATATASIVGSDIAHAVPLTLVAGIGHRFLGSIDWHLPGFLLAGSLPGIVLGSRLAARVPGYRLAPRSRNDTNHRRSRLVL